MDEKLFALALAWIVGVAGVLWGLRQRHHKVHEIAFLTETVARLRADFLAATGHEADMMGPCEHRIVRISTPAGRCTVRIMTERPADKATFDAVIEALRSAQRTPLSGKDSPPYTGLKTIDLGEPDE